MNKIIKLLLTFGLGFLSVAAHATCECEQSPPPPSCNLPPPLPPGDLMPEGAIVDNMPTVFFADVVSNSNVVVRSTATIIAD